MDELLSLSTKVGKILVNTNQTIATAESCTGGLLGHILTSISGSSQYFPGGVIAYGYHIKEQILGVQHQTLMRYGAVSEKTALEMASGIRGKFKTDIGLSTTGIAGPTGGTPTKPVGLVWIAISTKEATQAFECHFKGSRETIKNCTVKEILTRLMEHLEHH